MVRILPAILIVVLVGCSQQALLEKFASPDDQAFAKSQFQALQSRDFDSIEKAADPTIRVPDLRDTLAKMADLIPAGEPKSTKLVGAYVNMSPGQTVSNITYEYSFPEKWLLVNVAARKSSAGTTLVGFNVKPLDQSLEEQNRFTLSGKSILQYAILAFAAIVPLFSLYALIQCIRTPFKGRKWPWVIFILVGIGRVAVNWTTGQWSFSLLQFQLLGASISAPLYGPWTIAVSVPLGAILFFIKREKLRAVSDGSQIVVDQAVSNAEVKPKPE